MPYRSHRLTAFTLACVASVVLSACSDTSSGTDGDTRSTEAGSDDTVATSSPVDSAASTGEANGSTSDATGQTGDAAAATGDAVRTSAEAPRVRVSASGDAFAVRLPTGWSDAADVAPEEAVLTAESGTPSFGFFTNLVVTEQDPVDNLKDVVAATAKALKTDDNAVKVLRPVDVDGEKAYGYSIVGPEEDLTISREQRFVQFDDRQFVLTFSTSRGEGKNNNLANREFDSILKSWRWGARSR